jgi:hypothetical protein
LKKRPRAPPRMQARAIPTARWVLPEPVPPTRKRDRLLEEAVRCVDQLNDGDGHAVAGAVEEVGDRVCPAVDRVHGARRHEHCLRIETAGDRLAEAR